MDQKANRRLRSQRDEIRRLRSENARLRSAAAEALRAGDADKAAALRFDAEEKLAGIREHLDDIARLLLAVGIAKGALDIIGWLIQELGKIHATGGPGLEPLAPAVTVDEALNRLDTQLETVITGT